MDGFVLGQSVAGEDVAIYLERLIGSHLCVSANSGGGKSGAIRKLLEATHGKIQHIILDSEDEFYTLRERYDYLIAGGDNGDCAANVNNAAALAMTTLKAGFSAIFQINSLGAAREQFVATFLDTLRAAPRSLWRPLLIVIDEAQALAPEQGYAVSKQALIEFMIVARKRGFTAVLATPRSADLSKKATSPVNNWLLGRAGQPADRRSSADALGFSANSDEARGLRKLEARNFWAFGPALCLEPTLTKIGKTETTIVKAGQAMLPTPPAPAALKAMLKELNAAAASQETGEAQASGGKAENAAASNGVKVPDPAALKEAEDRGYSRGMEIGAAEARRECNEAVARIERAWDVFREASTGVGAAIEEAAVTSGNGLQVPLRDVIAPPSQGKSTQMPVHVPQAPAPKPATVRSDDGMPTVAAKILAVIDVKPARAFTWTQIAMLAGYSEDGGQYRRGRKWLIENGVVIEEGGRARIAKPSGRALAPTGEALIDLWKGKLPSVGAAILTELWRGRRTGTGRSVAGIANALNHSSSGGQFRRGIKSLKDACIADVASDSISFTREFLELAA